MDVNMLFGVTDRGGDMANETEEIADNLGLVKRRKLNGDSLRSSLLTFVQTKGLDSENCVNSPAKDELIDSCNGFEGFRSSGVKASCCSSTGSIEKRKASDLEGESVATDTAERHKLDGSESSFFHRPASEFKAESDELETITAKQSPVKEKMPPEAELEEFFAAAQKDLNKRFKDKYNYDILNDIPTKGRFEWIQVKPGK